MQIYVYYQYVCRSCRVCYYVICYAVQLIFHIQCRRCVAQLYRCRPELSNQRQAHRCFCYLNFHLVFKTHSASSFYCSRLHLKGLPLLLVPIRCYLQFVMDGVVFPYATDISAPHTVSVIL